MARIPLTQGKFAVVDDADFEWLSQWKWYALKQPNTFYACRDVKTRGVRKTIWMHRLINETPSHLVTDHISGDGLDNRRANLRSATHQENMVNNARHRRGSSRHRGVSWHIRHNCWVAQITVDYRNIYIGRFRTEEAAAEAYRAARARYRAGQIIREEEVA